MNKGQRVLHQRYGKGTVLGIMFKDTLREIYLVRFDNPNEIFLHSLFNLCEEHHGLVCKKKELEVIEE